MNVLSLFDGLSCGQLALQKANKSYDNYYASEIDKDAIKVTQHNFPNTIQLGDVTKVTKDMLPQIDLLIGGSPCQGFSFAGKQLNFDDERSKLFFEFVRLKNELNPKYFLLENVRMKWEHIDVITHYLGVNVVEINSNKFVPQNRPRLYWTNIPIDIFTIPITRQTLENILLPDDDPRLDKFMLSKEAIAYMDRLRNGKPRWEYHTNPLKGHAACLTANMYKGVPYGVIKEKMRRLHPIECERLQGVPEFKKSIIFALCLDQAKNYVNVVSQSPKLQKLVLVAEKSELNESVKNVIANMSANPRSIKSIAPQNVDTLIEKKIGEFNKTIQEEEPLFVNNAEKNVMCNCQNQKEISAVQNVFINITEGQTIHIGKGELVLKEHNSIIQKNGSNVSELCGNEIVQLAKDVEKFLNIKGGKNFTSTTLFPLSMSSIEQTLIIYYLFAKNVIDGFIQNKIQTESILLNYEIIDGYTSVVSTTQRLKMLGNGWTVDAIAYIFRNL